MLQTLLHWLGFGLCHQLPDRSFFGGGVQAPVCARDTGIYVGFVVSLALISFLHGSRRPTGFPKASGWVAIGAMIAAMAWDGVTSYAGFRTTTNDLRLLTGLTAGFAIAAVLTPMLNDELWRSGSAERVLAPAWRLGAWLGAVPITFALIRWAGPFLGIGYPILIAVAVIATLTAVNMVIVCLTPPFERRADRLSDAWLAILMALILTVLEIWLSGLLRYGLTLLAARYS